MTSLCNSQAIAVQKICFLFVNCSKLCAVQVLYRNECIARFSKAVQTSAAVPPLLASFSCKDSACFAIAGVVVNGCVDDRSVPLWAGLEVLRQSLKRLRGWRLFRSLPASQTKYFRLTLSRRSPTKRSAALVPTRRPVPAREPLPES